MWLQTVVLPNDASCFKFPVPNSVLSVIFFWSFNFWNFPNFHFETIYIWWKHIQSHFSNTCFHFWFESRGTFVNQRLVSFTQSFFVCVKSIKSKWYKATKVCVRCERAIQQQLTRIWTQIISVKTSSSYLCVCVCGWRQERVKGKSFSVINSLSPFQTHSLSFLPFILFWRCVYSYLVRNFSTKYHQCYGIKW